jgi:uncharacterized protein
MNEAITRLVAAYGLQPHPEGGFFAETYRSAGMIPVAGLPAGYQGERPFATAIYFLVLRHNFSAFHRLAADEIWHFYTGGRLLLHLLEPNGHYRQIELGGEPGSGTVYQAVVPACCWFAAECAPETDFSFTGCTVAPGFDFADFELAERAPLVRLYPQHAALITRLTRQ